MTFNQPQQIALASYAGGEFNGTETQEQIDQCGDSLFKFLMIELSDAEDCFDLDTAYQRVNSAIFELQEVSQAIARAMTTGSQS